MFQIIFMLGVVYMKNAYIEQIVELLQHCDDLSLLDLIYKLLKEAVQ